LSLIDPDQVVAVAAVTEILEDFPDRYQRCWLAGVRTKLGLVEGREDDAALAAELLDLLTAQRVDYTSIFRALSDSLRGEDAALLHLFDDHAVIHPWMSRWRNRLETERRDPALVANEMDLTNPVYIPRNHLVEEALAAAGEGELAPFHALLGAVSEPFADRKGWERYASPAPEGFDDAYATFCGT